MNNVEFLIAKKEDIASIMDFIKNEWDENHILAKSKKLFNYFYLNSDGSVNFVLARNKNTKEIYAIRGYRVCSNKEGYKDFFGAVWKAKKCEYPMLGVALIKYIQKVYNIRCFLGVGSNPNTTIKIVEKLGYHTGKLQHFYRLNKNAQFKIAVIKDNTNIEINNEQKFKLKIINSSEELARVYNFEKDVNKKPFKDLEYIKYAYFEHIAYKYIVYGLLDNQEKIDTLIIGREIEQNGNKIFRIVDIIGEEKNLAFVGKEIDSIIAENDYEYIDLYCVGIDKKILNDFGFIEKNPNVNVIPNYFEPFVQSNVDIYYFREENQYDVRIFKGDADQDRPSIITWNEDL